MRAVLTRRSTLAGAAVLAGLAATRGARAAEPMRIGLLHTLSPAPLYLAMQRGYFRDQNLDAQFRFFEAAQPIAAAAVSGDIDVGITALTGGFFSLAGRGTLKVIAGGLHEQKGFQGTAVLVSRKAFEGGLTSLAKLPGHSFGITQYGSSFHYMVGRMAELERFDLKSLTLRPLQSIGNMLAAVRTAQVEATMAIASQAKPLDAAGEARIIAWCGDVVPYQLTAMFTTQAMLARKREQVAQCIRAYQRGVADYREAFLRTADGKPVTDAMTDAAIKDIQAFLFAGDPEARRKILDGVGWYDLDAALDARDVAEQLRWFTQQDMVKGRIDPADIVDSGFVPTLATPG